MALATVAADKRHLTHPQGEPFFVFGVNYVGYFDRSWKMWENDFYDSALIARDFRKIQNSGFNTVRLFVQSALTQDIRRDTFDKLDETLSLAQDHNLLVLLTLNDAHALNLAGVGEIDAKIAARYKEVPTILAYDLENEPVFYNLAAGIYPEQYQPPIQTSRLVDHYGVRVKREEIPLLQQNRRIPGHLDEETAFYYINGLRLFLEYDEARKTFIRQRGGTVVDFMMSAEATPWHTLISVLHETVEAWLQARSEPIRAAGSQHLLTVGWNWLQFAALPANHQLDFQAYHNYVDLSLAGFNENIDHLRGLQRAFPDHPILFEEFGWSNQSGRDQAGSQPVSPQQTALYEAATYAYLRSNSLAGGMKWMLNDVAGVSNPYEASFGLFEEGDISKPIRALTHHFSETWPPLPHQTTLTVVRDVQSGLAYRLDAPQTLMVSGATYQDQWVSWQSDDLALCTIWIDQQELIVEGLGPGRLSVDPWDLIPTWNRAHETDLYRLYGQGQRTRQHTFEPGENVILDVQPGIQYAIALGEATPVAPPPEGAPEVDPKAGEHVLLLGDFENYLHGGLRYIRRFAPDFTFAAEEVGGRWAYVSVIATVAQVPDTVLDDIRAMGAIVVERVIGDTPEQTKAILDEMAERGQRFLTAISPLPPQEDPPGDTGDESGDDGEDDDSTPPGDITETYIVQPGDTLSKIARKVYGEARLWTLIFEANLDKISSPSLIRVGMELHIPAQE